MKTASLKIAKLTPAAAEQFDRYVTERDTASAADKASRGAKDRAKDALSAIEAELGDYVMGQLPDGRVIHLVEETRDVKAQDARTDRWKKLLEVPTG